MTAPKTVLLAEDDENDAFLLMYAFKLAEVSNPLIVVRNGQEAIWYLNAEGPYSDREKFPWPCVLLLDLKMPLMNGFDVLEWLKDPQHRKGLPVIVLSSSDEESDVQRAMALGANAYRVKSCDFNKLALVVEELRVTCLDAAQIVEYQPSRQASKSQKLARLLLFHILCLAIFACKNSLLW